MKRLRPALAAICLAAPDAAWAGQPFLTDDPVPTDTGHWQVYFPQFAMAGMGHDFAGVIEAEIDYGPAPGVQLAFDFGQAFSKDANGTHWGMEDVRASIKYRFYDDESGFQVAVFPAIGLPTATRGMGPGRVTAFLPIWAQKDMGPWSVFGGGGYAVNPGSGNRNYWVGSAAVTRQVNDGLLLGAEIQRVGADTVGGAGSTNPGVGAIVHLVGPLSLYTAGGPSFGDDGDTGFHVFTSLAVDF